MPGRGGGAIPVELRAQALGYLKTHNTLTLATVGPEGPWAAALFYVNDAFSLYWLSDPRARHSQNIARHPRVAVTINEDYRDWRLIQGLQMEGTAEEVGTIGEAAGPMRLYAAKYTFLENWQNPPAALAGALRAARVYRFVPVRVLFIDNTKAFGHREEISPVR
jgi:uncharacterized protein YhbP (UPF0306 family)